MMCGPGQLNTRLSVEARRPAVLSGGDTHYTVWFDCAREDYG